MKQVIGRREWQIGKSGFGLREASVRKQSGVYDDEEALGSGENGPVRVLDFGLVEELAALAAEVSAGEDEGAVEGNGL